MGTLHTPVHCRHESSWTSLYWGSTQRTERDKTSERVLLVGPYSENYMLIECLGIQSFHASCLVTNWTIGRQFCKEHSD